MEFTNPHDLSEAAASPHWIPEVGTASGRQDDYAWTHTALVEGLFAVLTIVIVPVALLRWLRRFGFLSLAGGRRRRGADS